MVGEENAERPGDCFKQNTVLCETFFPYDLYLENERDFDTLINNMNNFYHWCASRVLSLDRKYAKEILNSIGMAQAITDRDRAQISLSYHCVSLTDIYWVKEIGLHQIKEIEEDFFEDAVQWKEMFFRRLEELKKYC